MIRGLNFNIAKFMRCGKRKQKTVLMKKYVIITPTRPKLDTLFTIYRKTK